MNDFYLSLYGRELHHAFPSEFKASDYEVALVQAGLPSSIRTINSKQSFAYRLNSTDEEEVNEIRATIPAGYYADIHDVIQQIVNRLNHSPQIILQYNAITRKVKVLLERKAMISFNAPLAKILGLPIGNLRNEVEGAPVAFSTFEPLLLWSCPQIVPTACNSENSPILHISKVGDPVQIQCPIYHNLKDEYINEFSVSLIRDTTGRAATLSSSNMFAVFHFRYCGKRA